MEEQTEQLPPLDQDYLKINYHEAGFSYLLPEILALFHSQIRIYLQNIEQLYLQGDLHGLAAEAHTLKGTAGSVGATALAAAAAVLEHHAASSDSIVLNERMVQLRQVLALTDDAIIEELARLAAEDDAALNLL
jgi:HPt (histidine-containing phosphotransfer) domain-containing protein